MTAMEMWIVSRWKQENNFLWATSSHQTRMKQTYIHYYDVYQKIIRWRNNLESVWVWCKSQLQTLVGNSSGPEPFVWYLTSASESVVVSLLLVSGPELNCFTEDTWWHWSEVVVLGASTASSLSCNQEFELILLNIISVVSGRFLFHIY